MYIVLCQSYVISKVHACTFVTCSLNVIDDIYRFWWIRTSCFFSICQDWNCL